uniref:Arylacetamide deacetylase like 3 n=1 Tax=Jaculus jaculus TaxID=51337 RepID=A0A8C5KAZ2_JACJA
MVGPALALLAAAGAVFCVGVFLWVVCSHFLTVHIPKGIGHPVKLRVLTCLFQLSLTWGNIFEKLGLCSAPQFASFVHDLQPLRTHPDVVVTDLCFGSIPVKLYKPKAPSRALRAGIIFYHGGGAILGSLRTHHNICLYLSKDSDSVVLSVGYRKAPKYKFPVIRTDCTVATVHFLKSLHAYGVDPARVVVCGDSVGGAVASVISQMFVNRTDLPRLRAQVLIYSALQALDFQSPSFQQNKNIPLLTWDFAFYCWCCHLGMSLSWKDAIKNGTHLPPEVWEKYRKWLGSENIPERFKEQGYQPVPHGPVDEDIYLQTSVVRDWTCSPLLVEDDILSQVPETCIVSCEYDLLRDHSLLYKKRLEDLGVPVTWHHMEDGFHGVLNTLNMGFLSIPCSSRIMNVITQFIKGL